jgi:hypothetical protein
MTLILSILIPLHLVAQGILLPDNPKQTPPASSDEVYEDILNEKPRRMRSTPKADPRPAAEADAKPPELDTGEEEEPKPSTLAEQAEAKGPPVFLVDLELASYVDSSVKNTTSEPTPGFSLQHVRFHSKGNRLLTYGLRVLSYNFSSRNPYLESNHSFYGPTLGVGIFNPAAKAIGAKVSAAAYARSAIDRYGESEKKTFGGTSLDFELIYLHHKTLSSAIYASYLTSSLDARILFMGVRLGFWY